MAQPPALPLPKAAPSMRDIGFAFGIVVIICVLFLPIPPFLIDLGLAFSIAFSVLILMVALWIQKPLEFSSFPTILLIATMTRLALNIATTRVILSHGNEGHDAAGGVIAGFASLVMSGDFVIGLIVFLILITINFIVITKGATRIAEVGARFTLDAIPGKQMSIDADLSAGIIDEKEAQRRRKELEEESSFFGAMDGASKFVRGDAVAGLLITCINVFGGIIIGYFRHGMPISEAADVFVKLSVGDGLVSQMPALIVSLGRRPSRFARRHRRLDRPGRRQSVERLSARAFRLRRADGDPGSDARSAVRFPSCSSAVSWPSARGSFRGRSKRKTRSAASRRKRRSSRARSWKRTPSNRCCGRRKSNSRSARWFRHASSARTRNSPSVSARCARSSRRSTASSFRRSRSPTISPFPRSPTRSASMVRRSHRTLLRVGEVLVVTGAGRKPRIPGDEIREPAFGMPAVSILEAFTEDLKREGFQPIDNVSVVLTHMSEVIRNNLPQLLSYKDVKVLIDRLDPEYKKLADEICTSHMSYSGLQAVLKLLLAERVSIRNLHLILEAVAELAPHVRKTEQIVEHVRIRMAQQLCGDLADNGVLRVAAARQQMGHGLPSGAQARQQGRGRRIRHRSAQS